MKRTAILLIAILAVSLLGATVAVRHDPPISLKPDREVVLDLEVLSGFDEIDLVNLYYRETGATSFVNITMEQQPEPSYTFNVPQLEHPEKGLEYYFEVTLTNGTLQTLPSAQPALNPYRVQFDRVEAPSDDFVRLSPEAAPLPAGEPLIIAISTFAVADRIKPETIAIIFDGDDMTEQAEIAGNMIVLRIDDPGAGTHSYQVSAELNNGRHIVSRRWQTRTKGGVAFEMPLNITGRIDMSSLMRSFSGDDNSGYDEDDDLRQADWNINLRGRQEWFGFFTRLFITSRQTSSDQSVNRYTVGFTTPFADVTLGDKSPDYDSFTMSNKNVRGVHALFHSKDFRFYFNYGQNRQAIENVQHTSFKRTTLGFRTEVGELDAFQWGISVVKNKDDIDSIDEEYFFSIDAVTGDSTIVLAPKDNIVIGTDFLVPIIKRKLEFGFEMAGSLYNSNIYDGVISTEELEDYGVDVPFDPESFESLIVINKNMEPFIPNMANVAYRAFVNFNMGGNFFTASFSDVGASYNSLSANYLQKDTRTISLTDNVMLFQNQLLLSVGMNLVSDNLSDQKETTNTNTSFFVQAVARPNGLPTVKLGFSQSAASDDGEALEDDGYLYGLEQTSQSITVGLSYEVVALYAAPTTFEVNWQQTASADDLNDTFDNTMNTISISGASRFRDLPLTTVIRYSNTASDQKIIDPGDFANPTFSESSDAYNSVMLRANLRLLQERLKPYVSFQITSFGGDGDAQSTRLIGAGTSYDIVENFEASTSVSMKNYSNSDTDDFDYSKLDLRFRMRYTF
ncbi:MAG: hypothetical protein K8R90_02560 [Candidatus Cloacimonetes bacterium]|nr:hypothetical protein [Candidatus Cloacimonadota bacterium]